MGWQDGFAFALTEEEEMVLQTARDFARKEVLPLAAELDRDHRFPEELLPQMVQLGFMGATVPEAYGGSNLSYIAYAIIIEELAAACASTSIICSAHNSLCVWPILAFGTEEQKQRLLPPLASGGQLGCFALSEPGTGSDAASLTCTARRVGEKYIINGTKNWITNGPKADVCVLFATTDVQGGHAAVMCFAHPMDLPGVQCGKLEDKLGIRASPTSSISYQDVELGAEHVLGAPGVGFKIAMKTLDGGRIGVAAQALGIGRAALEDSLAYAKERKTFGKPIGEHQSIQNYLADMITRVDAARYLTFAAARLKDQRKPHGRQAAMAKLFASEMAMDAAVKGVQIHGGYGYVSEYPAERHMRDAKITEIYEGTSEIQRLVIASHLLKES